MNALSDLTSASSTGHPQQLQVADEQQGQIHAAAARLLTQVVWQQVAGKISLPVDLANLSVAGTFVSLKRAGHLRSCCGGLQDRAVSLGWSLADAVQRTALDDVRFPPVSPTELAFLDMEVWLLFNPQSVKARGMDRIGAVTTGGKHGLIVGYRQHRGLLLPGVAQDHGWDSKTFLEQVCIKAGLHASRWKDDATSILTFEGIRIQAEVGTNALVGAEKLNQAPFLSSTELTGFGDFIRYNVWAFLSGATPRYSPVGLPDGNVNGLVLTIREGRENLQLKQFSLGRSLALHATLFQFTQHAAQILIQRNFRPEDLNRLEFSLAVFYDPALHGTAGEPDLRGCEPARRALLVLENGRSSLVYDTARSPKELLAEAALQGPLRSPTTASVFSLETNTTESRLSFYSAPQTVQGPAVRPPALAGTFYPADKVKLFRLVDDMLAESEEAPAVGGGSDQPQQWKAAMVPHAGMIYSGRIAANVFKRLAIPSTVIILGPKHTDLGAEWAVAPHQHWSIPGATLAADPVLARALAQAIPGLVLDAAAHQQEHAIEVELPFLARLAPQAKVVGVAIGPGDLADCHRFAEGLAQVVRKCSEPPLLLISSDMNHFASDAETRRLDDLALTAMANRDAQALYDTVKRHHISMCGLLPAVIVMETLRLLGQLNQVLRVGHATTADVTGDPSWVVGYAGMLLG